MATQIRPFLKSGAALASVAAIAVAAPAFAPKLTPTPNALSTAQVELTTISDLMSIPGAEWSNVLFSTQPWGGSINNNQLTGLIIQPYANTCTNSDGGGQCFLGGISGVAYLALDALINGNGEGWSTYAGVLQNPSLPYQPDPTLPNYNPYTIQPWTVSVVNYLFEPQFAVQLGNGTVFNIQDVQAGLSAASQYVLQATLGTAFPALSPVIEALYYGPYLLTIAYVNALNAVADTVVSVPLVGPFVSDSILAYIGRLTTTSGVLYIEGLSGVLQYWGNILNGTEPFPTSATATTAASVAPAVRAAALVSSAAAAEVTAAVSTASDSTVSDSTGSDSAESEATESEAIEAEATESESTEAEAEAIRAEVPAAGETPPVEATSTDSDQAVTGSVDGTSTESGSEVEAVESIADTTPSVDSALSAVATGAADAEPAKASKRSGRSAAERVAKKVGSTFGGVKAATSANGR